MDDITVWGFVALAAAATLVGFSKTAVSGANTVSLAVFAAVLPARESTGVLLPVLIVGDVLAVLGAILLLMAGVTMWRRHTATRAVAVEDAATNDASADDAVEASNGRLKARSYGVLGGFTTMVANAGGPVMSLYLLSAGFQKLGFLGTSAWFFLIVNTTKVPFSVGLGLIDGRSLLLDVLLALFVFPGAIIGKACVNRINQRLFERLVIGATILGGIELLLR